MSSISINTSISSSSSHDEEIVDHLSSRKRALSLEHPSKNSGFCRKSLSQELDRIQECDIAFHAALFSLGDLIKCCIRQMCSKGFEGNCIFVIQTYHYFGTSEEFFTLVKDIFNSTTEVKKKALILQFIMEWLRRRKRDMESELYISVIEFITGNVKRSDLKYFQSGNEACQINHPISLKELSNEKTIERSLGFLYIEWKPQEIAEQLTILHSYMFRQIRLSEFMNQAWQSPEKNTKAPFLTLICDYFNEVSRWVATCILTAAKMGKFEETITRFIKIAKKLNKLHNFHMQQAIIAGLTHASVIRLEWNLSKDLEKDFLHLESLMSPIQNHRAYRTTLRSSKAPVLPCVTLILSDITFITTGNTDFISDTKSINYEKFALLGRELESIWLYQEHADYILKSNTEILNFLKDVTGHSEDTLYDLSYSIIPQGDGRSNGNTRVSRRRSFSLTDAIFRRSSFRHLKPQSTNEFLSEN